MNFIALFAAIFTYVNHPFIELREGPSTETEVVSQLLYAEEVDVLEEEKGWSQVVSLVDDYVGWVKSDKLYKRKDRYPAPNAKVATTKRMMAHLYSVQEVYLGPFVTLPYESPLQIEEVYESTKWVRVALVDGKIAFIQKGDLDLHPNTIDKTSMCNLSLQFLGLPYTWGGRSSFGYDCSGFTQMLYRQMGLFLPRDSKDQCVWSDFKEIDLKDLSPGDLIFFGLNSAAIRHVALYLGEGYFIHSTMAENAPYLRISSLSDYEWSGHGRWGYRTARTFSP